MARRKKEVIEVEIEEQIDEAEFDDDMMNHALKEAEDEDDKN